MARGSQLVVCATLILLALSGCGGGGSTVVAQVGSERITSSALDHWVAVEKDRLGGGLPVEKKVVLSHLIGLHWVLAEAAEYGLRISSSEAHRELALLQYARRSGTSAGLFTPDEELELFADDGELQRLLVSSKLSSADRVWLVSLQTLVSRIRHRLVADAERGISQERVASFYRAHRSIFVVPEKRDIEVFMTVQPSTAAQGKRDIEAGEDFQSVVKRLNIAPEADNGLIMGLARNEGELPILEHFFGARPHVLMGPVTQALTYVFRVSRVYPSYLSPLAMVAASIRRKVAEDETSSVLLEALKQRWQARTGCSRGYRAAQCRR